MKRLIFGILSLFAISNLQAQTLNEAALLAQSSPDGTARYIATGGAFTALGADASTVFTNPAGIALYRSSLVNISMGGHTSRTSSDYLGRNANNVNSKFEFGNATFIKNNSSRKNKDWKAVNVGVGYNQHYNYHQQYRLEGTNNSNSLLTFFENQANQIAPNFTELAVGAELAAENVNNYMAWQTYLLNLQPTFENQYESVVSGVGNVQRELGDISGRKSELAIALGGNYKDKLYLGGGIGVPFLRYQNESIYSERDEANNFANFDELEYSSSTTVEGLGFNARFGAIYKVLPWLRVGASVQTPEWMSLTSTGSVQLESQVAFDENGIQFFSESVNYEPFNYRLRTAPKLSIGGALISKKLGFISFDADFIDYSSMRYNETNNDLLSNGFDNSAFFEERNNEIQDNLQATANLRLGGELVLKQVRLMAGAGLTGSPYSNESALSATKSASLGIGYQGKKYSLDMGYARRWNKQNYSPYNLGSSSPTGQIDNRNSSLRFSFGWRF